ncbi:MAG: glycosyltransferase family 2 protein [Candidatus Didemnitutus sp.]|nr:glycosyltransferase family 2 protein [Candidatus Didemnitutus sp.]
MVSVLVPTYNYARFLPQALQSVLAQDYPNLEILVSDDCSTDDTATVVHELAQADPRVRVVLQPRNLGMVPHWNWCLTEARGAYVKFLFGDDAFNSRHAISRLVGLLENQPTAAIATSARRVMDEYSRPLDLWNPLRREGRHEGRALIGRCLLANQNLIGEPSAVLLRRSALDRDFSPAFRQLVDLELWLHLLESGDLAYTPEPLVGFRRHDAQQTRANHHAAVAQQETLRLIAQFLDQPAKRTAAGLTEFDYRLILYRASHYLKKAERRLGGPPPPPEQTSELSPGWRLACQLRHAVQRPMENLRHSLDKRRDVIAVRPEWAAANAYML